MGSQSPQVSVLTNKILQCEFQYPLNRVWCSASMNKDEEIFADPYRFDIERTPNEHIAFGQGEHFCAGAHLARLELRLMMDSLVHKVEQIELAGPVDAGPYSPITEKHAGK
jgi:cytochrome P450